MKRQPPPARESPIADLLRLIGGLWLALALVGLVVTYSLLCIWQTSLAVAHPPAGAAVAAAASAAFGGAGALLLALAGWLDASRASAHRRREET